MPKPSEFERELRDAVAGDVVSDDWSRALYATDASLYQIAPRVVVTPAGEDDVCAVVRIAARHRIPLLPRGAGTSLSGQAVGNAIVIDFSKHMNRVLECNFEERWARVQPGVVLDELNAQLALHRLHFAPDPATASRATIGGMIGNNSAGTRSIVYGMTSNHVLGMRVLLADATILEFQPMTRAEFREHGGGGSREARLYAEVSRIVDENRDEIAARYPKVMRRVGGYRLDAFLEDGAWDLSQLIVGSEGTLATVLETKIRLEPLPAHTAICVPHFRSTMDAIRAVRPILDTKPAAVEILDHSVIRPARRNLTTGPLCDFLVGDPEAILIVQFFGNTADDAAGRAEALAAGLRRDGIAETCSVVTDPQGQANVWTVRKHGLGLMLGMRGDRKPLPFIEDAAVPVEVLPDYIAEVLTVCERHDTDVALYAHASVGLLHVRPILDLRRQLDIDRMKAISEETFMLVRKYKGSWSGEHGDGLVRSAYNERFFGPRLYDAFKQVKRVFDPDGIMNPGKIVDAPPIDEDLRYGTKYRTPNVPTQFQYREDGSFAAAVQMCNGVGECRKTMRGTMCPSYMATMDEAHSTRGRANALRLAMSGQLGEDGMTSRGLYDILDLCLGCKACKSECPSNVDMAKLKAEFLQGYHDRHGLPLRDKLVGNAPRWAARLSGWPAPVVNALQRNALIRRGLETITGIDRRRSLPFYAKEPLHAWFDRRTERGRANGKRVALFADTFTNYHDPGVGRAAVTLLEDCGYRVELLRAGCCQRTRISQGMLREAKADGTRTLERIDDAIREGVPVAVLEPGCASALTDDLPDLVEDAEVATRVRDNVMMIDVFLDREQAAGRIPVSFSSPFERVLLHGHCHQKALYGTGAIKRILALAPRLSVDEVDSGCCGMAGAFGYEKEHYDLSMKIGERRLFPAVREAGPDTAVIASGFSCRHQIRDATGVEALHWVEALRVSASP